MSCGLGVDDNLQKALTLIGQAAQRGAQIICLQELFRSQYFCQKQDATIFDLAEPIPGPSTEALAAAARHWLRAQPGGVALAGVGFAVGAALCRVAVLLITRAKLHHADSSLTTWYSILSSTAIFAAASLLTWTWHGPQTAYGLFSMILLSLSTVIAVLALFVSIKRIGPFRSALIMNLEPLLATIISAPVLGELITPVQAVGGAIMLAALVAFQLRR
jgi:drug/metabolite transporter (DMT)-like permease